MQPRIISILTTSWADYGIYRPIIRTITADPALVLNLFGTGLHFAPEFGNRE